MSSYNIFNNILSITVGGTTGGAVSSVAGKTGAVILDSNDVTNFQPSVSTNSDVVDNKSKTQNIDKNLTVLNSTKFNGDLIATKFKSSDYYDETGASGIKITQTTGEILLNSNSYITNIGKFLKIHNNGLIIADLPAGSGDVSGPANSTPEAVCVFNDSTGKVIKNTAVTITNTNTLTATLLKCTDLNVSNIFGYLQSDISLQTDQGGGLIINQSNGNIEFNGQNYLHKVGDFLQLSSTGGIILPAPAVSPPPSSTLNAVARYSDSSGKIIKNSNVLISDTGRITAPEIDGRILINLCNGLLLKGDITPELNTDIINLGAGNLPIARIYLNSANNGGVYIDGVKQTFGGGVTEALVRYARTTTEIPSGGNDQYQHTWTTTVGNITNSILANPEIYLPTGRYLVRAICTGYNTGVNKLLLYQEGNVVNNDDVLITINATGEGVKQIHCEWYVNITDPQNSLELRQLTQFGVPGGISGPANALFNPWGYASLSITKL
jgi:hypothetical protein